MWLNLCLSHAWQILINIIESSSNFVFALFWGSTSAWQDILTLSLPNAIRAARVNQRNCIKMWMAISQPSVRWRQQTVLKMSNSAAALEASVAHCSVWRPLTLCSCVPLVSVQEVVGTSEESKHHTFPLLPAWWVLLWFLSFQFFSLAFFSTCGRCGFMA